MNAIQDNRIIFLSNVNKESKRFAWGRQTAFEDILKEDINDFDWDSFMQGLSGIFPRDWIREGLDVVFWDR